MAQMCFFDLSDRYAKKDSLVDVNAVVQWEGSGQHWNGSGAIFRGALTKIKDLFFDVLGHPKAGVLRARFGIHQPRIAPQSVTFFPVVECFTRNSEIATCLRYIPDFGRMGKDPLLAGNVAHCFSIQDVSESVRSSVYE